MINVSSGQDDRPTKKTYCYGLRHLRDRGLLLSSRPQVSETCLTTWRPLSLRTEWHCYRPLPLRGNPLQVIVIDSDSDSDSDGDKDEGGGVTLLCPYEGLCKGDDDEDEGKNMAPLAKSRGEPNAEEYTDLFDNSTGFGHSELVRLETRSRWVIRVEGASRFILLSPTSLRVDPSIRCSLAGTMTICHWWMVVCPQDLIKLLRVPRPLKLLAEFP